MDSREGDRDDTSILVPQHITPSYLLWCSYIHTPRLQSTDLAGQLDNLHLLRSHPHPDAAAAVVVLVVLVDVDDDDGSGDVHDDDSVVSVFSPWLEAEVAGAQ